MSELGCISGSLISKLDFLDLLVNWKQDFGDLTLARLPSVVLTSGVQPMPMVRLDLKLLQMLVSYLGVVWAGSTSSEGGAQLLLGILCRV